MKDIKVLIISHNPITTYHNMGKTLKSLFKSFSADEMCQLYCYPTIPDIDICSSYYRITDRDVFNSLINPFKKKGRIINKTEINENNSLYEEENDRKSYQVKQDYKRLLRDLMWKVVNWYTDELKEWLKNEKPTCIFVAPGDAAFLYSIALKISADFSLPIYSYICDEYYFSMRKKGICQIIRHKSIKHKIELLLKRVDCSFFISNELKVLYEQHFNVLGQLLMTGAVVNNSTIRFKESASNVIYMGNIRCGRYKVLKDIGLVLDEINSEENKKCNLLVYTDEYDTEIIDSLKSVSSIKLFSFLKGNEYTQVMNNAELLLHVESFEEEYTELVKYSVSTKIASSLASGIPLFAYGPDSVSSMKYLVNEDCAIVAIKKEELKDKIKIALCDVAKREYVSQRGLNVAKKNHDIDTNSTLLKDILSRNI